MRNWETMDLHDLLAIANTRVLNIVRCYDPVLSAVTGTSWEDTRYFSMMFVLGGERVSVQGKTIGACLRLMAQRIPDGEGA